MKSICSNGGPLVGINRDFAHLWSGINGKNFIGTESSFRSDYDAACDLVQGVRYPPCNIAKISGLEGEALLITLPFETTILDYDRNTIKILQIEAAESGWSIDRIVQQHLERTSLKPGFLLKVSNGSFVFFDATLKLDETGDDHLECQIEGGLYECSDMSLQDDEVAALYLLRMDRK